MTCHTRILRSAVGRARPRRGPPEPWSRQRGRLPCFSPLWLGHQLSVGLQPKASPASVSLGVPACGFRLHRCTPAGLKRRPALGSRALHSPTFPELTCFHPRLPLLWTQVRERQRAAALEGAGGHAPTCPLSVT